MCITVYEQEEGQGDPEIEGSNLIEGAVSKI